MTKALLSLVLFALPAAGQTSLTLTGILFDAACRDRSAVNVSSPPETLAAAKPVQPSTKPPAHGISVDPKTLAAEQADVMQHQSRDLYTRQQDPSCAITGGTSGYAIRLDDGRMFNLDEGGNTLATEAVLATSDGRAMLNGIAYGFKPRVTVEGRIRGDRVLVKQISPK